MDILKWASAHPGTEISVQAYDDEGAFVKIQMTKKVGYRYIRTQRIVPLEIELTDDILNYLYALLLSEAEANGAVAERQTQRT